LFITVCGQKGGVAKTCTSIHLASVWHTQGKKVCIVDADKNRSALAYSSRGNIPFPVFPVSSAAKGTRDAEIVITDGQASSDEEELKQKDSDASIFDDINSKLPSITRAFKTQRKAKKLNLTYLSYEEALADLLSEVKELEEAENLDERKSEIGDVLFAIVNVCRYLDADPEIQLNKSTQRFIKRAQYVEKHIEDDSDLEKLWLEAKKT